MATALTRAGPRTARTRITRLRLGPCVAALALIVAIRTPLPAQPSGPLRVEHGTAVFTARATFGPFSGVTTAVRGAVSSPTDARAASGWVEVALDSLRTGNGTRDRHMRDALETAAHPTARFELDSLVFATSDPLAATSTGAAPAADNLRQVRLHGRFRVHGVARPLVADGTLQPRAPAGWQLAASFPVTLAEHEIRKGLSRALGTIRVQPVVQVRVELVFAP